MKRIWTTMGTSLLLLSTAATPLHAGKQETKTLEAAAETVKALSEIPLKGLPRFLVRDAAGVAIVPHVVKAGLIVDGRFGRGILMVHEPDGRWSSPVFISLSGAGVGGVAGIEATELVLVFKTKKSLDRVLQGKLTLGGDAAIAAGPLGRDTEAATDLKLKAEVYSYSRSKGLFAGVSLEGSKIKVEQSANESFYGLRGCQPGDILGRLWPPAPPVEAIKIELAKLSGILPAAPQPPISQPPVKPD